MEHSEPRCATPGIQQMKALGITTVFDLRSDPEMEKYSTPIPVIEGVQILRTPVFTDEDYSPESMAKYVRAVAVILHPLVHSHHDRKFELYASGTTEVRRSTPHLLHFSRLNCYRRSRNYTLRYSTMVEEPLVLSSDTFGIDQTLHFCFIAQVCPSQIMYNSSHRQTLLSSGQGSDWHHRCHSSQCMSTLRENRAITQIRRSSLA
jgi:hypothetical protein